MNEEQFLKHFWNTCSFDFAHLNIKRNTPGKYFNNLVNKYFDLKGKIILDFGGGGGYFGKYLFDTFQIGKYIDVDISERNLRFADNILRAYNTELNLNLQQSFEQYSADYFFCKAVIHHFPNSNYLNWFLSNLNNTKIKGLYLTIKVCKDQDYSFILNSYKKGIKSIGNSCLVNINYIAEQLTNYELVYENVGKKNQATIILMRK